MCMCARARTWNWQGLMDSDHTTWVHTLRRMHTQTFLTARSHPWRCGDLTSGFMELADILLTLNLKVGILLPVCPSKLYFQPCQGL